MKKKIIIILTTITLIITMYISKLLISKEIFISKEKITIKNISE